MDDETGCGLGAMLTKDGVGRTVIVNGDPVAPEGVATVEVKVGVGVVVDSLGRACGTNDGCGTVGTVWESCGGNTYRERSGVVVR